METKRAELTLKERVAPGSGDKLRRWLWSWCWLLFFRASPTPMHAWRRFLLRLFGARIGEGAHVYPSAKIWAPWNLTMGRNSCLADGVECYDVDRVELGDDAIVSQRAFLCTASHNYAEPEFWLVTAPIRIEKGAWIAAEAFVGPGVAVHEGAVVAARSVVTESPEPWTVVAGNPARFIKRRPRP